VHGNSLFVRPQIIVSTDFACEDSVPAIPKIGMPEFRQDALVAIIMPIILKRANPFLSAASSEPSAPFTLQSYFSAIVFGNYPS